VSAAKGTLKVYLGYIVSGYFEPHGRKETIAKTEGLEVVPRRTLSYGGSQFEEMDADAVLRRKPAVAVVDEFAHTNVPGAGRLKRWEDVHAIVEAGIDVLTTMNVQHLESLNDQVFHADELVFVDLTPRALRNRLERGVVYSQEKARRAMENFFTETNLTALREMALRHTAHEVEEKLDAAAAAKLADSPADPHAIAPPALRTERILVCLTGRPSSAVLIRRGKRVADYIHADCLAVHVGDDTHSKEAVERHMSFARNLRIETHVIPSGNVSRALAGFARTHGVTQIFMGRSAPLPWWKRYRETIVQQLVRQARDIQITIVAERRR
jgi:two-component system sensor histidine kinase KdpD